MHVLIVYAHQEAQSFNAALLARSVEVFPDLHAALRVLREHLPC